MADIAKQVSGLPEHLQQVAFTTLLNRTSDYQGASAGRLRRSAAGKLRIRLRPPAPPKDAFGQYYATFPVQLTMDQKVLVAASFAEAQSSGRTYTTQGAHDLLRTIGIKSTNVGVYARRLVKPKGWAVTVGKAGKKIHKFRISNQGRKELNRLRGSYA